MKEAESRVRDGYSHVDLDGGTGEQKLREPQESQEVHGNRGNLTEDFLGRTVIVVRTGATPIRGELTDTGPDGITIKAEFKENGYTEQKLRSKRMFVPWTAIQGIS